MGTHGESDLDAWVRAGGFVVAASERARRALLAEYHRARRDEGLSAWDTPPILDWNSFVRNAWNERVADGRLLLNGLQEQSIWARVISEHTPAAALLTTTLRRMAGMAMDAHGLLCGHASRFLEPRARTSWRHDAGAFSRWLQGFEEACRIHALISGQRLAVELVPLLEADDAVRPPLLLVGFDHVLPTQKRILDAWGPWRQIDPGPRAGQIHFYAALDVKSELDSCATWCHRRIAADPKTRILVITQDAAARRGELERALLRSAAANRQFRFEFSLGVPLAQVSVVRTALLLLRWLDSALAEHEIDWLFSTDYAVAHQQEAAGWQAVMRRLRRRGLARPRWALDAWVRQRTGQEETTAPWATRMKRAEQTLAAAKDRKLTALEWGPFVQQLLKAAGWPGARGLSSVEYQALQRFEQTLEICGSLGFDGRRMGVRDFLFELNEAAAETLFAPESENAPILITGPAESAGLHADAIWFLGAHEEAWPARGALHPLLPPEVQREFGMPHGSPQLDFELARTITQRLTTSGQEIHFSYARQTDGVEARPSRLIEQFAGPPAALPAGLATTRSVSPLTMQVEDRSRIPFTADAVQGGSAVLTYQSQCPFKAFAAARLGAQSWEAAQPGLTPMQRGQLLHAVLHAVWGGAPHGLGSLEDLLALTDRRAFVAAHVAGVLSTQMPPGVREQMPERYFLLEERRLTSLVTEWLEYEAARLPFAVEETEAESSVEIAGLKLKLRLDRVDRLNDGSVLVVDYKTGDVSPKAWNAPRPDDVQLPLYAGFGLGGEQPVGGLVFAKLRAGDVGFAGCIRDAAATLGKVNNIGRLRRSPLSAERLEAWRETIEDLARAFVDGRADVDPRDRPETCERCGLHALCRIHEATVVAEEDPMEEDADD